MIPKLDLFSYLVILFFTMLYVSGYKEVSFLSFLLALAFHYCFYAAFDLMLTMIILMIAGKE